MAGIALAALISHNTFDKGISRYEALAQNTCTVEGVVTEVVSDRGYEGTYKVRLTDIENNEDLDDFFVLLTTHGNINEGSVVRADMAFSSIESTPEFDALTYYHSQKIFLFATAEKVFVTGDAGFSLSHEARKLNRSLSAVFTDLLSDNEGSFAAAIFLGNKDGLSPTVRRDFTRLGISHILAISGMHLAILCSVMTTVFSVLGKKAGQVASVLTVVFYMMITGFSSSVTRSGIMLLLLILASFARKAGDRFTNLGLAVFLICIVDPFSCADIGLQLSFSSVFAILLYTQKRHAVKARKKKQKEMILPIFAQKIISVLVESSVMTVIIVLFMLPLEWLYFGQISLISPLTSPIFSLLCTLLLWILPIVLICSPAPTFAALVSVPAGKLISLICSLAESISRHRDITVSLDYPFSPYFCIAIFICICAFCVSKRKKRIIFAGTCAALVGIFALSCVIYLAPMRNKTVVTMLNHNKSDGIVLYSDHKIMIVDISNGYSGIYNDALFDARKLHATEIEAVMLTHIHNAHVGTLNSFFQNNMVRTLIVPEEDSSAYLSLKGLCEKHGVSFLSYTDQESIEFENALVHMYPHGSIKRSNQPVIRLDIESFDDSFTYLGGAYYECFPDEHQNSRFIWFGVHGPLYKEEFTPLIPDECTVFAGETVSPFLTSDIYADSSHAVILGDRSS